MTTALLTDRYELSMLRAAIDEGIADRPATFEMFARSVPKGSSFGVFAGLGRIADSLAQFTFPSETLNWLVEQDIIDTPTRTWLERWDEHAAGLTIDGYPEGELFFANSPVLSVTGPLGACLLLETLLLSIVNYDSAVATRAAWITRAANGKPVLEMGTRRTHEQAAVAAARAAYIGGFASTSNLQAGYAYGLPTFGTAAHAWTLAHATGDDAATEQSAFEAQLRTFGPDTTLLVDTFNIPEGIRRAVSSCQQIHGQNPAAIRLDSGDLGLEARKARALLDELGAHDTKIVVSSDLDAPAIRLLEGAGAPIDAYGVGTRLVANLPAPGFVYKLVQINDGTTTRLVQKKSASKQTIGGRKTAYRITSGQDAAEILTPHGTPAPAAEQITLANVLCEVRDTMKQPEAARQHLSRRLDQLGDRLWTQSTPALPTTVIPVATQPAA